MAVDPSAHRPRRALALDAGRGHPHEDIDPARSGHRPRGAAVMEHPIWNLTVRGNGAPRLAAPRTFEADPCDTLSVVVPAGRDAADELGLAAAGLTRVS